MKNLLSCLMIFMLIIGCTSDDSNPCANVLPSPNNLLLDIQDSQGNSLIGTVYVQDSFRLRTNNSVTYVQSQEIDDAAALSIFFTQLESGESYYLDLSETETDTLRVNYTATPNECFVAYEIDQVVYNGEDGTIDQNLVTVTKD
ncbi:MAG: hypothetical protein HKM28_02760 [Flavobacteriaceae bacterium]|nr:hypothetical protein [Flavobacteriaceae bacterium]